MPMHRMIMLAPMLALLIWAAVGDLRTRKIRNWLTLTLAASGVLQSLIWQSTSQAVSPSDSILGLCAGFGLTFALFALGALGGGDVKLLAGVGAWVGPTFVFVIFLLAAVMGMVIVLGQAVIHGRVRTLFRNSAVVAMNLVHVGSLGTDHVAETGKSCRSVDKPLPYAIPVLLATLVILVKV